MLPDTQQILDKTTLIKRKAQDRQTVFYPIGGEKNGKGCFSRNCCIYFVNLLLLWLYPLSTVVSFLIRNLNNTEQNGRHEGSNSGGPYGY